MHSTVTVSYYRHWLNQNINDLGYVPRSLSRSSCQSGSWTPTLDNHSCVEGVVLMAGGMDWNDHNVKYTVEAYGPGNLGVQLSNLPESRMELSLNYVDGAVYLCGDKDEKVTCLKGEHQATPTKGQFWVTLSTRCVPNLKVPRSGLEKEIYFFSFKIVNKYDVTVN